MPCCDFDGEIASERKTQTLSTRQKTCTEDAPHLFLRVSRICILYFSDRTTRKQIFITLHTTPVTTANFARG